MPTLLEPPTPSPTTDILQVAPEALCEVIDGRFVEKNVGAKEIWTANILCGWLFVYLRERRLGRAVTEMIFQMGPDENRRRRPDLAFVSADRHPLDQPLEGPAWRVTPDLVAEVVSPTDRFNDIHEKVEEYLAAGVRIVWLISFAARTVWIHDGSQSIQILKADDVLRGGDLLPGFEIPLRELLGEASGGAA